MSEFPGDLWTDAPKIQHTYVLEKNTPGAFVECVSRAGRKLSRRRRFCELACGSGARCRAHAQRHPQGLAVVDNVAAYDCAAPYGCADACNWGLASPDYSWFGGEDTWPQAPWHEDGPPLMCGPPFDVVAVGRHFGGTEGHVEVAARGGGVMGGRCCGKR